VIDGATHTDLVLDEEAAAATSQAILDVVSSVRSGGKWAGDRLVKSSDVLTDPSFGRSPTRRRATSKRLGVKEATARPFPAGNA
jgi:hypothetical protein